MPDLSLESVGANVLTEGVRFLYLQAGELLKRRRERRDAKQAERRDAEPAPEISLPTAAFAGQLTEPVVDDQRLDAHGDRLRAAWVLATPYGSGVEPVEPTDPEALARVEELRVAMEQVLGQRVTFLGERREPSGLLLTQTVGEVSGEVEGPRVDDLTGGATLEQRTGDVTRGGKVAGPSIGRADTRPGGGGR